jgi:hypothetical protein
MKDTIITMKTRNQTKPIELTAANFVKYEVNIDFDEASNAWQANKKSIGNSSYKYVCQQIGKTGTNCKYKCLAGEHYCSKHLRPLSENL